MGLAFPAGHRGPALLIDIPLATSGGPRLISALVGAGQMPEEPLVLIVEDDLSTRVMYMDYLSTCGFRISDAHNGHQALAKARELRPDIVLTDLAVPGMDGFEFCRALQQSDFTRAIPILAVTGHSEYLDQPDRFRQAGILNVLTKPCAPDVIAGELRRLLQDPPSSHSTP